MRGEDGLELGGRDLEGVDLDELLEPVDDEDLALLVDDDEVAGAQPPVGVDHRRGGVRAVQVARHRLRPAHPQLAGLARAEIGAALAGRPRAARCPASRARPSRARRPARGRARSPSPWSRSARSRGGRRRRAGARRPRRAISPATGAPPATTSSREDRSWASTAGWPASAAITGGGPTRTVARWRSMSSTKASKAKLRQRHGGRARGQRVGQRDDEAHDVGEGRDATIVSRGPELQRRRAPARRRPRGSRG